jgi:hypothetical protein
MLIVTRMKGRQRELRRGQVMGGRDYRELGYGALTVNRVVRSPTDLSLRIGRTSDVGGQVHVRDDS